MQKENKNIVKNTSVEMLYCNISTKSKGFTLVELIIVITILSILATIAFISFQGYTKDTRDGIRMSDIKQIYNGLSIYKTQTEKTLLPDNYINIQSGTTTISYQGYAGTNVLRTLKISGGKDPGTKDYYIYTTDVNSKKAQLMTYMETSDKDVQLLSQIKNLNIINQAQAVTNTGYYQDKKIYVYGDKIGILTNNKIPLQETTTNTGIDITSLTGNITTYFGGTVYNSGTSTSTGLTLINQINGALNNTLPCSPTTYNGYNITSLQDKQIQTFTKTGVITGGTQTGNITTTCNNGILSYGTESFQTSCTSGYTLNGNSCDLNKYSLSGTITNGSGGTINLCGTSTSINSSGNFSLSNVNHGTNCSSITITRSGYNCSISTDGPNNLTGNISNIAGSCSLVNYYSGAGTSGNSYRLNGVASNATTTDATSCQYYNLNATTNSSGNTRGAGTCGTGSQECLTNGIYLIDPDGSGGVNAFEVTCDMVTSGGGWTQYANARFSLTSGSDGGSWNPSTGTLSANGFCGSTGSPSLVSDISASNWKVHFRPSYSRGWASVSISPTQTGSSIVSVLNNASNNIFGLVTSVWVYQTSGKGAGTDMWYNYFNGTNEARVSSYSNLLSTTTYGTGTQYLHFGAQCGGGGENIPYPSGSYIQTIINDIRYK